MFRFGYQGQKLEKGLKVFCFGLLVFLNAFLLNCEESLMKFPILQIYFHFYYNHLKFLNPLARCIDGLVMLVWKTRKWKSGCFVFTGQLTAGQWNSILPAH